MADQKSAESFNNSNNNIHHAIVRKPVQESVAECWAGQLHFTHCPQGCGLLMVNWQCFLCEVEWDPSMYILREYCTILGLEKNTAAGLKSGLNCFKLKRLSTESFIGTLKSLKFPASYHIQLTLRVTYCKLCIFAAYILDNSVEAFIRWWFGQLEALLTTW